MAPTLSPSSLNVADGDYARLLGYPPGRKLEGEPARLAAMTRAWFAANARPWVHVREVAIRGIGAESVELEEGTVLRGPAIAGPMSRARAHGLLIAAISAGPEIDAELAALWERDQPARYYFLDAYGSAVVERLRTLTGADLCSRAEPESMSVLPYLSPGYKGWDLGEQIKLMNLLRADSRGDPPGPLEALESGMLQPVKSMLTVFGLTRHGDRLAPDGLMQPCTRCSFTPCQFRRAPYQPRTEQNCETDERRVKAHSLESDGSPARAEAHEYGYPTKALERWRQKYLQLEFEDGGAVRARFRFDGSTCNNMGMALSFIYDSELAPEGGDYRVRRLACAPTEGDRGYEAMCAYVQDPAAFEKTMVATPPLEGWTLDEVLAWDPETGPAGCLCEQNNRDHKWRIALQTIHYGLRQHDQSSS